MLTTVAMKVARMDAAMVAKCKDWQKKKAEAGFAGIKPVLQMGSYGGGGRGGFEPDDALFKTFEMPADDDFADPLDGLRRIEWGGG